MKSLLFIIMSLGFAVVSSYGQSSGSQSWQFLNDDSPESLLSVHCIDSSCAVIVGTNGYIIRTTDRGNMWNEINSPNNENLNKVEFINDTLGFILGCNGTLFRSEDAGLSWIDLSFETTFHLYDIFILNDSSYYVSGGNSYDIFCSDYYAGAFYFTDNWGQSWEQGNYLGNHINSMFHQSVDTGFIANGNLLYTTDGWESHDTIDVIVEEYPSDPMTDVSEIYWIDDTTAYLSITGGGYLLKTINAGESFFIVSEQWGIYDIEVVNDNLIFLFFSEMPGSGVAIFQDSVIIENTYRDFRDISITANLDFGLAVGSHSSTNDYDKRIYRLGITQNIPDDEKNDNVSVFPNPNDGRFFVKCENDFIEEVKLYSYDGRLVSTKNYFNGDCVEMIIDGMAGMYIVEITTKNEVIKSFVFKN